MVITQWLIRASPPGLGTGAKNRPAPAHPTAAGSATTPKLCPAALPSPSPSPGPNNQGWIGAVGHCWQLRQSAPHRMESPWSTRQPSGKKLGAAIYAEPVWGASPQPCCRRLGRAAPAGGDALMVLTFLGM